MVMPTLRVDEGVVLDHLIGPLLLVVVVVTIIIIDVVESVVEVIRWEEIEIMVRIIIIIIAPLLGIITTTTREDTMITATGEVVAWGGDIAVEAMDMTKIMEEDIITIISILLRGGGEDLVVKRQIPLLDMSNSPCCVSLFGRRSRKSRRRRIL